MLIGHVTHWRSFVLAAALAASCAACARDTGASDESPPADPAPAAAPAQPDGGTAEAAGGDIGSTRAPDAPAPAATTTPPASAAAPARRGSARDLSGRWAMFVRTNTWTVDLQPADGMPDEYAGMAERDARGPDGRPVNLTFGAVLINNRLKAWLGPGIIVCEAPFRTRAEMVGTCSVVLGEGEPGPFRARRLP